MEHTGMNELPDTPRWSAWRRGTANTAMTVGIAMIGGGWLIGARGGLEAVAVALIENGSAILMAIVGIVVLGASAERGVAWWRGKHE